MPASLETLTGEELLLTRILGDPSAGEMIAQELDRRALLGPPTRRRTRSRKTVEATARQGDVLVA